MKSFSTLLLSFLFGASCIGQTDSIQARIVLIGDAGELTNGRQPVISSVKKKY